MLEHSRAIGDTLTKLAITIQNDGVPRNLTGKTVIFKMNTLSGATVVAAGAVTVTSATAGECEYDFSDSDVDVAGIYKGWFVVLDGSSEPDTYPNSGYIQITLFDPAEDSVEPDPSIDIISAVNTPSRTRTVEGTVEERPISELIKADQYTSGKTASDTCPWGIRISRTKPGGMVT